MALRLYEAPAPNPFVVRLSALERGGLDIDVEQIDIMTSQNRRLSHQATVNSRGELPALRVGNETQTRIWLRRSDLVIAQPITTWFRNDPDTIYFYKGTRLLTPQARVNKKVSINQALNRLDDELEGKECLAGDRFSPADIHLYSLTKMMIPGPWGTGWVGVGT
ncbi:glutathione S-transferase domain-containing protein [Verticillium dahliae]|nr:glutathione S-transferase domain-containing protein [Verticillium dahliae]